MPGPAALRHERLIRAAALAPFLASFLVGLIYVLAQGLLCCEPSSGWLNAGAGVLVFTAGFGFLSLLITVAVGIPLHATLMRMRLTALWAYVAVGALVGASLAEILRLGFQGWTGTTMPIGLALGGLTAGIAWLIRRPDHVWA